MRKFLLLLILTASALAVWATPLPYIRQYNESYTVDLASDAYLTHLTQSTYQQLNSSPSGDGYRNTGKYYREQELGVVGILYVRHSDSSLEEDVIVEVPTKTNNVWTTSYHNVGKYSAEGDVTITVTLLSGEWFYSLSGGVYKRPFGLDVFCRGRVIPKSGTAFDADIPLYSLHLGNQAYSTDLAAAVQTATIPASIVRGYDFIWWDICLVMDPIVDTSTDTVTYNAVEYPLLPSKMTYSVDLEITLSCGDVSSSFPFHLEGYYKTDAVVSGTTTGLQAIMTVTQTANNFRIEGNGGLLSATDPTEIATYDFTTTSKTSADTSSRVYLFLSSSPSGVTAGNVFSLHHVKDPNGFYVTPLVYTVTMKSCMTSRGDQYNSYVRPLPHRRNQNEPVAPTPPGDNASDEEIAAYNADHEEYEAAMYAYRTVEFTGTDSLSGSTLPTNAMEVTPEITKQKPGIWYTRWNDNGTLSVQLTGKDTEGHDVQVGGLKNGMYTSDIYIHVIMF